MKILFCALILFFIPYASFDVLNEIVRKYEKIHPQVTQEETEEVDKLLNVIYSLATEDGLPATKKRLNMYCLYHRERTEKALQYVKKRWPLNIVVQIAFKLMVIETDKKNEIYCDDSNRRHYLSNAVEINDRYGALVKIRKRYNHRMVAVANGQSSSNEKKLAYICCATWEVKADLIEAMPTNGTKEFVADMLRSYCGETFTKYLCQKYPPDSKRCETMTYRRPRKKWFIPKSIALSVMQAIAVVTTLT